VVHVDLIVIIVESKGSSPSFQLLPSATFLVDGPKDVAASRQPLTEVSRFLAVPSFFDRFALLSQKNLQHIHIEKKNE